MRTHLALGKDAPPGVRAIQRSSIIVAIPILSGLHHYIPDMIFRKGQVFRLPHRALPFANSQIKCSTKSQPIHQTQAWRGWQGSNLQTRNDALVAQTRHSRAKSSTRVILKRRSLTSMLRLHGDHRTVDRLPQLRNKRVPTPQSSIRILDGLCTFAKAIIRSFSVG